MKLNQVTAVLPARNCRRDLNRCLRALAASAGVPQIIVVDDGSEDGTEEMVRGRWPSVTMLRLSAHTGFAHAANAGLRLVRTKYAFLIRPDLLPGRDCVKKLLEAMEPEAVFCAVPSFAEERPAQERPAEEKPAEERPAQERPAEERPAEIRSAEKRPAEKRPAEKRSEEKRPAQERPAPRKREILAVPDGCAMYRMSALEEIGWMDERHFDGLEAFDLSLRAALYGYRTVRVPGSHVRGEAFRRDTFHRQLASGNGLYVFYKNLPGPVRLLTAPVRAASGAVRLASFIRRGEAGAWHLAAARGRALCSLEKERREALGDGVSVWAENLSDASFLGMEGEAQRQYPLFLAEKEPAEPGRIFRYLRIQGLLARDLPGLMRLLG